MCFLPVSVGAAAAGTVPDAPAEAPAEALAEALTGRLLLASARADGLAA